MGSPVGRFMLITSVRWANIRFRKRLKFDTLKCLAHTREQFENSSRSLIGGQRWHFNDVTVNHAGHVCRYIRALTRVGASSSRVIDVTF